MTPRALQIVQRLLITATTVVLALVVGAAFLRIIRPPDPAALQRAEMLASGTTEVAATVDEGNATVPPTTLSDGPADGDEVTTTTVAAATEPPNGCQSQPPPTGSGTVLRVYFTCGEAVTADSFVYRAVPDTELVLTATLTEMVKGPDGDEEEAGFTSLFSDATTNAFAGVTLASGKATIDFTGLDDIGDLSSSDRAWTLLSTLHANVFQFDTIDAVEYRLGGSCDAFWQLVGGSCETVSRADWQRQLSERAVG